MARRRSAGRLLVALAACKLAMLAGFVAAVRRAMRWGSTPAERAMAMPGDTYLLAESVGPLHPSAPAKVAMTRAVTIAAPPEHVWPWLAQLARGAGWYSLDAVDNGGRPSARHLVTWIPEPALGDASAIGYLRNLDPGRALTWWAPGVRFLGTDARMVADLRVDPAPEGSRLVIRMVGEARGRLAPIALGVFAVMDSVMAVAQLKGIRSRVETHGVRTHDPDHPETGARDQYQLYETVYASGARAGVAGTEEAARFARVARDDGVLPPD